jgi:four helix bundle protein
MVKYKKYLMATVKSFEELEVWQLARTICKGITQTTSIQSFSRYYALAVQRKRFSGSIMDNIAEGFHH